MMKYRNTGAPFHRPDGTVWERDAVAEPTEDELRRRRYKLRAVGEERPEMFGWERDAVETPPPSDSSDWPLRMTPETYLRMHPDGDHAELARVIVVAQAEDSPEDGEEVVETDGSSDDGD